MGADVTLRELRALYPDLFYKQDWFEGEPFMDVRVDEPSEMPAAHIPANMSGTILPSAVALTWAYVLNPAARLWDHWFWCADTDRDGQQIFVGKRAGLWEIHRHLRVTDRWGVALWL